MKDINDNLPKFEKSNYSVSVLETATKGDLLKVVARDIDAENTRNSKINYRIAKGGKEKFKIDPESGVISIIENSELDRDLFAHNYTLEIIAFDFGTYIESLNNLTKSNETFCNVFIDIIDVNNKKPEFASSSL